MDLFVFGRRIRTPEKNYSGANFASTNCQVKQPNVKRQSQTFDRNVGKVFSVDTICVFHEL